jgi:polysaccharide export outer membrane protein
VVPVRPDGLISLPLVGEVEPPARSPDQVAETGAPPGPVRPGPAVVVIVREINAPRFFVVGEVARPGGFPLRNRTRCCRPLSLAGGPNEFASKGGIVVVRKNQTRIPVDFESWWTSPPPGLRPAAGDTIVVP